MEHFSALVQLRARPFQTRLGKFFVFETSKLEFHACRLLLPCSLPTQIWFMLIYVLSRCFIAVHKKALKNMGKWTGWQDAGSPGDEGLEKDEIERIEGTRFTHNAGALPGFRAAALAHGFKKPKRSGSKWQQPTPKVSSITTWKSTFHASLLPSAGEYLHILARSFWVLWAAVKLRFWGGCHARLVSCP